MDIKNLVMRTRTVRRFDAETEVDRETLLALADLGRMGASAGNKQPLKFICINEEASREALFSNLAFAAYLKDWIPAPEERPKGYIIICGDTSIATNFWCDHGIAAQNILLGATEKGLGGCILGAVNKAGVTREFAIPDHLEILLVIALGKPAEKVVLEPLGVDGDVKYWRDDQGVHHVPKRSLEEVVYAYNPPLER